MHLPPSPWTMACLTAGLALAACSGDRADNAADARDNVAAPQNVAAPAAPVKPATAQAISVKAHGLAFSYKWPAPAAAIPELDQWLRANGEKLRRDRAGEAASDAASAKRDGYPFHDHSYEEAFAVLANTPRMLVLESEGYVYTGGAHGMPINTAILWDKAGRRRLAMTALIDVPRFATLAEKRFCANLDRQREERRGAPVDRSDPDQIDDFSRCVDMTKQLLLPISAGPASAKRASLDTIRVVIGPYEAGPYAEGSYVIDLPLDAALLTAVKPAYRDAFAAR